MQLKLDRRYIYKYCRISRLPRKKSNRNFKRIIALNTHFNKHLNVLEILHITSIIFPHFFWNAIPFNVSKRDVSPTLTLFIHLLNLFTFWSTPVAQFLLSPSVPCHAFPDRVCSCSHLQESFYRAEGQGVNEEPQVARKGRPFSPPVVTQSAGRPTLLSRLSRSYAFSCRHYIWYIRGIGRGSISHGRLELRPYSTGITAYT